MEEVTTTAAGDFSTFSSLDMNADPDQAILTPAPNQYETIYVTSHKGPCRAGCFSPDGLLIATGSADSSIKILNVERMISKSTSHQQQNENNNNNQTGTEGSVNSQQQQQQQNNNNNNNSNNNNSNQEFLNNQDSNNGIDAVESNSSTTQQTSQPQQQQQQQQHQQHHNAHPVIKTLYDHSEEVTYLQFHPSAPVLASGSQDMTIKLYRVDMSAKRAHKTIQEASPVRCFTFHPSGNFMLVGCQQPTLRLYDVNTLQSYVSSNPLDQHDEPITMIDYNSTGSFYVTGSKNGDIKIWDGISNRCVNTIRKSHDGGISSVRVSRNGKYILSAGKDSVVKLWEMSMSSCLMVYEGATSSSSKNHRAQAIFNHTEDYVMFPDGRNTSLHTWNARNGKHLDSLPLCHNNSVRFISHSQVGTSFLTCSEDFRARFWSIREKEVSSLKAIEQ